MWLYGLGVLIFSSTLLGNSVVSKGALTETRFIVQNKAAGLKRAIRHIKKELTECYTKHAVHIKKHEKNVQKGLNSIESYHCTCKQLLYPYYIDELSDHLKILEKDMHLLADHKTISQQTYDEIVKRAFLIGEKVEIERKLLDAVFHIDRSHYELVVLKETHRNTWKSDPKSYALEAEIQLQKDTCSRYKSRIKEINKLLFKESDAQKIFLDELSYYCPA